MTSHAHHHDDATIAEILDLDAVVMQGYFTEAMEWVREGASEDSASAPVERILDVGAGTGAGTIALAAQFSDAHIVAVDISPEMLGRVTARAVAEGIDDRVSTVQLDLTADLPELGLFDIVWSSAALHEVPDAESVFAKLLPLLKPGGLIVLVEMDAPPRFLANDSSLDSGGALESRIHELLDEKRSPAHDHPDWSAGLERTGFIDGKKVSFSVDSPLEADAVGGRYAQSYWRRLHHFVAPRLSAPERVLFEVLLAEEGPLSLRRRDDLRLRAGRTAWAARRP